MDWRGGLFTTVSVIRGLTVRQVENNPAGSEKGGAARPGEGNGLKAEKGKESPSKEVPENKKVSGWCCCWCVPYLHQKPNKTNQTQER